MRDIQRAGYVLHYTSFFLSISAREYACETVVGRLLEGAMLHCCDSANILIYTALGYLNHNKIVIIIFYLYGYVMLSTC